MKRTTLFNLALILALLFNISCDSKEEKKLSVVSLFTNHMVLQQQEKVTLWGEYTKGEEIEIKSSWGAETSAVSNDQGRWNGFLTTPVAGGPFTIDIITKDSTISITDVLVGEVWLASGQSNMQMTLLGYANEPIDDFEEEIKMADFPNIRMFNVPWTKSNSKQDDLNGEWLVCSPESVDKFSASAYFFARDLQREMDVPIGIIQSSWGGTEVEAWMSKSALKDYPEFIEEIESFDEEGINDWVDQFEQIPAPPTFEEFETIDMGDSQILLEGFDDSGWSELALPHDGILSTTLISGAEETYPLNGVFWYQRSFILENTNSDFTLSMGVIDDGDVTFINGEKVGSTYSWWESRSYNIPSSVLKEGENIITIKHYDTGGGSAFNAPIILKNESGDEIDLAGQWKGIYYADIRDRTLVKYGFDNQEVLKNRPVVINFTPNEIASCLYNSMIHPLIPYNIKGAIWYQGESNVGRAKQYEGLFPGMINDWRERWQDEFSFYFVQIAPFHYGNELSPALRDAQRKSLSTINTGMVITMDIGDSISIHPGNKQEVGSRLARLALSNDYGIDLVPTGPLYIGHEIMENSILISFDHVGDGLILKGLSGFEIAGSDMEFVPAEVSINKNKIELTSTSISSPVYARYGWKDYIKGTLFNSEGLPASSFSTEE